MKKKRYVGAAVFMAAAIAASVPLGVNRSLAKLRESAAEDYYYDKTGYIIYDGIDLREAAAANLITVAERYSAENPQLEKLMDELDYRIQVSANTLEMDDETFTEIEAANAALDQPAYALAAELEKLDLSEKDKKYPAQLIAQMDSEQDKIKRSSYNDHAREFNAKVERMKPLALVKPLAVFAGPGAVAEEAADDALEYAEESLEGRADETAGQAEERADQSADNVEGQARDFAGEVGRQAEDLVDDAANWIEETVDELFE